MACGGSRSADRTRKNRFWLILRRLSEPKQTWLTAYCQTGPKHLLLSNALSMLRRDRDAFPTGRDSHVEVSRRRERPPRPSRRPAAGGFRRRRFGLRRGPRPDHRGAEEP